MHISPADATSGPDRGTLPALAGILGLGALLSWLSQDHPTLLPPWAPWDFSWPAFLATALPLWWFSRGLARTAPRLRPQRWRQACFFLGLGLLYAVMQTRFDYMAQHAFFLHRTQHIVMHHLGPFLLALAWPGATIRRGMTPRLRRWLDDAAMSPIPRALLGVLQQPVIAAFLFVGLVFLWLIPALHFRAMLDPRLYAVMNWSMVIDGLLFWVLILDPRPSPPARISYPVRAITAFLVGFPQLALGVVLSVSTTDLYSYYALCGRVFPALDPITDQQIGGLILWVPAEMMSAVAAFLVLIRMFHADERVLDKPFLKKPSPNAPTRLATPYAGD